jgi:hypothetical protein
VTAAREAGIKPHIFRKYLDRPEVRALLLRERRNFRDVICSANEHALRKVRDGSENGMAVIGAVRALEHLSEDDEERHGRMTDRQTPGVIIRIVGNEAPARPTIDITPIVDTSFDGLPRDEILSVPVPVLTWPVTSEPRDPLPPERPLRRRF